MEPVPRPPEQIPDEFDENDFNTFFDFAKIVHKFVFAKPTTDLHKQLRVYENAVVSEKNLRPRHGTRNIEDAYLKYSITYTQTLTDDEVTKHKSNIREGKPYPIKVHRILQLQMQPAETFLIQDYVDVVEYSDGSHVDPKNRNSTIKFNFDHLSETITKPQIVINLFKLWMRIRKELKIKKEFYREFDNVGQSYLDEKDTLDAFEKNEAYFVKKPSAYVKIAEYDEAPLPLKRKVQSGTMTLPLSSLHPHQVLRSENSPARAVLSDRKLVDKMWELGMGVSNKKR